MSGQLLLKIPNLVVRRLYVEHLAALLLPASEQEAGRLAAQIFCRTGNMAPLADFIEQRYFKIFDRFLVPRNDYKSANELTLTAHSKALGDTAKCTLGVFRFVPQGEAKRSIPLGENDLPNRAF